MREKVADACLWTVTAREGNTQRSDLAMFQWIGPVSPLPGGPWYNSQPWERWTSMALPTPRKAWEACLFFQGLSITTSGRRLVSGEETLGLTLSILPSPSLAVPLQQGLLCYIFHAVTPTRIPIWSEKLLPLYRGASPRKRP